MPHLRPMFTLFTNDTEAVVKHTTIIVACILTASTRAIATSPASQSAAAKLPIFVDHVAPPEKIGQLATQSDAIVTVRIESSRFESITDPKSGRPEDVTRYDARVLDVMKLHGSLPPLLGTFTLTRYGGQHTENGKVVASAEQGFPEFALNYEYLLFLTWNHPRNAYDIAYGPAGSFQLLPTGGVKALGRSNMAKSQQGKSRQTLLQELRTAGGR